MWLGFFLFGECFLNVVNVYSKDLYSFKIVSFLEKLVVKLIEMNYINIMIFFFKKDIKSFVRF